MESLSKPMPLSTTRVSISLRSGQGGTLEVAASQDRTSQAGETNIQISQMLPKGVRKEKMAWMTQNGSDDMRLQGSESIKVNH
jgi:hypothetical protein